MINQTLYSKHGCLHVALTIYEIFPDYCIPWSFFFISRGCLGFMEFYVVLWLFTIICRDHQYVIYRKTLSIVLCIWGPDPCGMKWVFLKNTYKCMMSTCASGRGSTVWSINLYILNSAVGYISCSSRFCPRFGYFFFSVVVLVLDVVLSCSWLFVVMCGITNMWYMFTSPLLSLLYMYQVATTPTTATTRCTTTLG